MDSKKIKPHTWLWWTVEDKPVYIWEVMDGGRVIASVPRPNRTIIPSMVNKVVRALDLEQLGEYGEIEY